ncbi:MAG: endonuclease MutS2 [Brevinematia bacterium]
MEWQYLVDLEFDKVLESISNYCFTNEGKKRVISTKPLVYNTKYSDAMQLISYKHSLISKAKMIYHLIKIPPIPYDTISSWKKFSKEGAILLPRQIYEIYEFLKLFKELVSFIDNLEDEFTIIKDLLKFDVNYFYDVFDEIEESVKKSIDKDGGIIRTATNKLDKIIHDKEKIETTVFKILTEFVNEPENEEFLQEKFVTIRNNRFVIPIKMEYINAIEGFVQDISSTGHTAFIEPKFIQPYTIKYLELIEEEREEVDRILREITSKLSKLSYLVDTIIDVIGAFDELQALARYSNLTKSERPNLSSKPIIKLIEARHPFLKNPVPITIELGDGENSYGGVIISGPNTSGKTVSIKTLGLLTAMALSGLLIPASKESIVGYFDKILADVGDPQSIEKNLSTFSAHIERIINIINLANANSLVILDEIGTGTDPREGEALAVAILKFLAKKKAKIAVATHYSLVKKLPLSLEYFKNAYMEFDNKTLTPLYKLVIGMPGSSNAIMIAHRLGLNEEIIQDAIKVMKEGVDIYEKFIIEAQNEKREAEKIKEELKEKLEEIEKLKLEYKRKINELDNKLEKIKRKEIDSLVGDIQEIKKTISYLRQKLIDEKLSQKELEEINKQTLEIISKIQNDSPLELVRIKEPKIGNKVFSNKFKQQGIITKIYPDGKVEILVGKVKMITLLEDLFEI